MFEKPWTLLTVVLYTKLACEREGEKKKKTTKKRTVLPV
jgi:hypothetical protein